MYKHTYTHSNILTHIPKHICTHPHPLTTHPPSPTHTLNFQIRLLAECTRERLINLDKDWVSLVKFMPVCVCVCVSVCVVGCSSFAQNTERIGWYSPLPISFSTSLLIYPYPPLSVPAFHPTLSLLSFILPLSITYNASSFLPFSLLSFLCILPPFYPVLLSFLSIQVNFIYVYSAINNWHFLKAL